MMRCSRPMSWAVASTWPRGGRRRTHDRPPASVTRYVRLERPPAMSENRSGGSTPGAGSNQPVTPSASMPSGTSLVSIADTSVMSAAPDRSTT